MIDRAKKKKLDKSEIERQIEVKQKDRQNDGQRDRQINIKIYKP